jgi:4-amino-4-deoxy-L-arabinose transferase-like glycosyltransferase
LTCFLVGNLVGFYNFDAHKYITIALNMMHTHQYILPYFQGHPYSDKGPLMFWLFILGWKIFGVNLWWPQLLMSLFATLTILATILLAKLFWPQKPIIALLTPYILIGLPNWIGLTTEIRVDVLLMFFCIVAITFIMLALEKNKFYWLLYAFTITTGTLCKGPTILIFTFVPALFLPFISTHTPSSHGLNAGSRNIVNSGFPTFVGNDGQRLRSWYGFLILFTLLGLLLTLLWAIPAAHLGGEQYRNAIFYHQISGRAAGHSSYFYYLIRLPVLLLPWILYVPFIYGFRMDSRMRGNDTKSKNAIKFCLLIVIISLIIFSFYGQKRIHYLNPDLPLLALIISFAITNFIADKTQPKRKYQIFLVIIPVGFALLILFYPFLASHLDQRTSILFSYLLNYKWMVLLLLSALGLFFLLYRFKSYYTQIISIMLTSSILTTALIILNMQAARHMASFVIPAHAGI